MNLRSAGRFFAYRIASCACTFTTLRTCPASSNMSRIAVLTVFSRPTIHTGTGITAASSSGGNPGLVSGNTLSSVRHAL